MSADTEVQCSWKDAHPRHVCDVRVLLCQLCSWKSAPYCYRDAGSAIAEHKSHEATHGNDGRNAT